MFDTQYRRNAARLSWPVLALTAALLSISATAWAGGMELIPSVGWTKSTDSNAGDAKMFGGLALRASALPFLKLEGGVSYREDTHVGGVATVRQWPVTASAWLKPGIPLYAGGGVGWYHTSWDFADAVPLESQTTESLGLHFGGGADMPLSPSLGLDLNGRYVWMQQNRDDPQLPRSWDPDFWTVGLGLALRF